MSNSKKKKKSTTKYKSSGFLIPAIAILETIVLIAVATFAWYYYSDDKTLSSALVTVKTDSGLEIDFKDADRTDKINVWNYLDNKSFAFEPASSVDGREIFFPTSGTFGSTNTSDMVFREGTGNDVNSKYVSIDFTLSNTNETKAVPVYLSGRSHFTITDDDNNREVGKALRLALYPNDGSSGSVSSNFLDMHHHELSGTSNSSAEQESSSDDMFTVYFETDGSWGDSVFAYIYDDNPTTDVINYYESDGTTLKASENGDGETRKLYTWQHYKSYCTRINEKLYSYTFRNPCLSKEIDGVVYYSDTRMYDNVIFGNGEKQTDALNSDPNQNCKKGFQLHDDEYTYVYIYNQTTTKTGSGDNITYTLYQGETVSLNTVYFLKPSDWTGTPKCRPSTVSDTSIYTSGWYYNGTNGAAMKYVTTGIYSYTYPEYTSRTLSQDQNSNERLTFLYFEDSDNSNRKSNVVHDAQNGKLYFFPGDAPNSNVHDEDAELYTTDYSTSIIYFYKNNRWSNVVTPYAYVNAFADVVDKYTYPVPMSDLGDDLYYCEIPDIFVYDVMSTRTDVVNSSNATIANSGLANNCQVFFGNEYSSTNTPSERTELASTRTNYIYEIGSKGSTSPYYYELSNGNYGSYLSSSGSSYSVIAPGVTAGFQRSASAVQSINTSTGKCQRVMPSFASSFDDYIMGSGKPLFTIAAGHTVNMSLIIWLEGTDSHCTAENYAANKIDLYLELATEITEESNKNFTYRFIDATKETWTSDTTKTKSGIEVDPVMLMYDKTGDHGYLMKPDPNAYDSVGKVTVWECQAPQLLADENTNHEIEFRRVNPQNEEEIWNRWDAGNLPDYRQYALTNGVVSFTAFGDSGPFKYKDGNVNAATVITDSACGGLWGNLSVQELYVYDGRKWDSKQDSSGNRTIKAGLSDISGTTEGNLFIKYTYNYGSGKSQTIEYKCSDDGHFYCFIVPSTIITKSSNASFSSYVFKSGKAINDVDYQGENVVRRLTTINPNNNYESPCLGLYYELNETYDNADPLRPDNCYWGSDIVYIQGPSTSPYLSVSYSSLGPDNSDHCKMRIVFCVQGYNLSVNPADSASLLRDNYSTENTKTAYLYDDKQSSNTTAYNYVPDISEKTIPRLAAVVPSDKEYATYNFYRLIDRVVNQQKFAVSRSVINKPLSHPDGALNAIPDGTSGGTPVDQHVLYLESDYKVCYIQATGSNAAVIHYGNNKQITRNGTAITANNNTYYRYDVPSNVESGYIEFKNGTANSGTISFTDGTVYVSGGSSFSATQIGKPQYNDTIKTTITSGSRAADDNWIYFKD